MITSYTTDVANRALAMAEVAKLCKENTTAGQDIDRDSHLQIFPNTASAAIYLTTPENNVALIQVYTITGRLVPATVERIASGYRITTNFRGAAILRIRTDQGIRLERIIFQGP